MNAPRETVEMSSQLDLSPSHPRDFSASFRLLRRGASGALMVQVGGAGLGLIVHVVVARIIGKAEYGFYAYALTWVSVLSVIALLGQSSSVVRFVPTYNHQQRWDLLRGLRRGASATVLAASCLILLLGSVVLYMMHARLGGALETTMLAAFFVLPVLTQLQLNGAFYRGFKHAASSSAYNLLLRPVLLVALILILDVFFRSRLSAWIAMLASGFAALLALVCSEWRLSRIWPAAGRHVPPTYDFGPWLKLGGQLFFLAILGIVQNEADVLVLGGLAGPEVVGPYYAAVKIAGVVGYGLSAVNTILAPMIAESYAAGDMTALSRIVNHAAKLTFVVTAAVAVAAAIAGPWILGLFGHGFAAAAYIPLLIILTANCFNAATGPVGYVMVMTRFERYGLLCMGLGAVLNLVLSVALIPLFGLIGAAIATATSTIAWNFAALMFVYRKLGINTTVLPLPTR